MLPLEGPEECSGSGWSGGSKLREPLGAIGSVVYQSMSMVQTLVLVLHQGFSFYLNFEFFFLF